MKNRLFLYIILLAVTACSDEPLFLDNSNNNAALQDQGIYVLFEGLFNQNNSTLAYFDNEKWYKALDRAEAYDWKGAMDMWMTLVSTNDMLRRSCAAYNIATACYMLGDYDLALEWIDQSDKDNKLPYSDALRKRITERRAF